jgi:ribulose-5-phosphate 4-epimerase/fuculose-1-phosphate aldolase
MSAAARERADVIRSPAHRQARIDLAAALRLAVWNNFHEGIDNHFSLATPGNPDTFLLNPYGLHWAEVRASDLLEVDHAGTVMGGAGIADRTAICIHGPVHRRGIACVLHTHMPHATALTQLEDMTLEMIGQTALGFDGLVAYDHDYAGLALDMAEGERLADLLGDRRVLMLANHGVLVVGQSAADAFNTLYFLERACQTQILAMSTGRKLKRVPQPIVARTRAQFAGTELPGGLAMHDYHFNALKRLLDRREPDYAE